MTALTRASDAMATVGDDGTAAGWISTAGRKRDGGSIIQTGWELASYRANPVLGYAHDLTGLPIGRALEVGLVNGNLFGKFQFAPTDLAATVLQLIRGRFLSAFSVMWDPIEWRYATGPGLPANAIDYIRQTLMEVSVVPVPADPECLVTARAQGIDTGPLARWAQERLARPGMTIMPRRQLEALSRAASMPARAPARRAPLVTGFEPTPANRSAAARQRAYQNCKDYGSDVPAAFRPPVTRHERECVATGAMLRANASTVDFLRAESSDDRRARLRRRCYEACRTDGARVPDFALPPVSPWEREALTLGANIRLRRGDPMPAVA